MPRVERWQRCIFEDCKSPFVHRTSFTDGMVHCDTCKRSFPEQRTKEEDKAQVKGNWQ